MKNISANYNFTWLAVGLVLLLLIGALVDHLPGNFAPRITQATTVAALLTGAWSLKGNRSRFIVGIAFALVVLLLVAGSVAMATSESPDLIPMDLSLPVIDGWEATRRIKSDPATQSIPVIALTAHAMAGDKQKALEAGCDDYETKPVNLKRLLGKIDNFLATC